MIKELRRKILTQKSACYNETETFLYAKQHKKWYNLIPHYTLEKKTYISLWKLCECSHCDGSSFFFMMFMHRWAEQQDKKWLFQLALHHVIIMVWFKKKNYEKTSYSYDITPFINKRFCHTTIHYTHIYVPI